MKFLSFVILFAVLLFPVYETAGEPAGQAVALSVDRARILALENNKDILIRQQDVFASLGRVTAEKGAFDPVFDISSFYDKTSEPSASSFISGALETERLEASMGITGRIPTGGYYDLPRLSVSRQESDSPVDFFSPSFSTRLDMKIGHDLLRNFGLSNGKSAIVVENLRSDITRLDLRTQISETLLEVERRYWTLVAAVREREIARKNLELAVDLLERNRIRVREGVLPALEEIRAGSEVAVRNVELIESENSLRKAEDELKNLLGLPLDRGIKPTDRPTADLYESTDIPKLIETAFENREELQRSFKLLEIAEEQKRLHSNRRLPKLAVEGVVSLRGLAGTRNPQSLDLGGVTGPSAFEGDFSDAVSTALDDDFMSWRASITMSIPIGNRGAKGLYTVAEAEMNSAVVEYKKAKETVTLEVKEAADAVWSGYKRVEAAKTALGLAEEVLEAEREKYAAGLSTTREVLEAQRDLGDAWSKHITSLADYKIALAALERATGTIIEKKGIVIP